jgi:hypothetical protein
MPANSFYRTEVEHVTKQRMDILDKYDDIPTIEREMAAGQIEEVIQETKEHLDTLPDLVRARIWEHGTRAC